ncbi:methyl-CpG-binding domain protein 2-like [Vigna radiata var. radiata]|uniref:Methyl-CpG-binding domain protein 2-like n=1 Tax=Vigna radiata var. radiata TaxID=3916 RepID=A0A1S3U1D3_VIGRR|nr:methyl-CpG-binding domain protein 2-like [Vigna radiata var. radiata]
MAEQLQLQVLQEMQRQMQEMRAEIAALRAERENGIGRPSVQSVNVQTIHSDDEEVSRRPSVEEVVGADGGGNRGRGRGRGIGRGDGANGRGIGRGEGLNGRGRGRDVRGRGRGRGEENVERDREPGGAEGACRAEPTVRRSPGGRGPV